MFVPKKVFAQRSIKFHGSGNMWEGSDVKKFHAELRRIFDRTDIEDIKKCMIKYAETVELITCRCPKMGPERADWAVAMALAPEWYGEELCTRIQNSMLVSALLLTVTASIFMSPPLPDKESLAYRLFIYTAGVSNMLFIMSIMVGMFFIENAMSRAYCQAKSLF